MSAIKIVIEKIIYIIFISLGVYSIIFIYNKSGCREIGDYQEYSVHKATITHLSVERAERDELFNRIHYYLKADYSYNIGNKTLTSERVSIGYPQWYSKWKAEEVANNIMANKEVYVSNKTYQPVLIRPEQLSDINTVSIILYCGVFIGIMGIISISQKPT